MQTLEKAPTSIVQDNKPAPVKDADYVPSFGDGKYSPAMLEMFKDAKRIFKLSPGKAERLARNWASDWGVFQASGKVKVGAKMTGKENKLTLRELTINKGVTATLPISAMIALQYANEAMKHGFNTGETKWVCIESLQTYLNELKD